MLTDGALCSILFFSLYAVSLLSNSKLNVLGCTGSAESTPCQLILGSYHCANVPCSYAILYELMVGELMVIQTVDALKPLLLGFFLVYFKIFPMF